MDIISSNKVKTRKTHKCWGCTKDFPTGTIMDCVKSADEGRITAAYWCEDCQKILTNMESWRIEDGFAFGELLNETENML